MTKYLKIFPLSYYIYRQFRLEKFRKIFLLKRILSEFFFNLRYDKFLIKKFHFNNSKFINTINYSKFIKKNLQKNTKKKNID